jgi:hypothetical protein
VGDQETIEKGGRLYSVRIKEEPRHGGGVGSPEKVVVAIIHRLT